MTTIADIRDQLRSESQINDGEFWSVVYEPEDSITSIMEVGERKGGEKAAITLELAIDEADTYDENDPLPAPIEGTEDKGFLDYIDIWCMARLTGHAQRAAGPSFSQLEVPDPDKLMRRLRMATRKKVSEQGIAQVEYQVSPTNAFPQAGELSRVANPLLVSWSVAGGGDAVDADELVNLVEGGAGEPYGCKPDVVICANNQRTRCIKLAKDDIRHDLSDGNTTLVLAGSSVMIGTTPVKKIDDMTNTIMLALSGVRDGSAWELIPHSLGEGGYDVLDLGPGEGENPLRVLVSTSFAIANRQPQRQGILSGLLS